ncbi:hypothetical protein WA026_007983 [Henosepilachna vigintioctopunctata]|uniref:Transmembrane protein n=1 Tax=Henosepilachna vigintioctopunctata TaxID=420089 RepID=A0AAW1TPW2_9CUCU
MPIYSKRSIRLKSNSNTNMLTLEESTHRLYQPLLFIIIHACDSIPIVLFLFITRRCVTTQSENVIMNNQFHSKKFVHGNSFKKVGKNTKKSDWIWKD